MLIKQPPQLAVKTSNTGPWYKEQIEKGFFKCALLESKLAGKKYRVQDDHNYNTKFSPRSPLFGVSTVSLLLDDTSNQTLIIKQVHLKIIGYNTTNKA